MAGAMKDKTNFPPKDVMSTSKSTALPSDPSHMNSGMLDSATLNNQGASGSRPSRASNSQPWSGGTFGAYVMDHLHRMHHDIEATTRKLELERRRLHTLDEALVKAQGEFANKREKHKIFQSSNNDEVSKSEQKLRKLETRLDKAISVLNEGEHENIQLREQIDQLRKERYQVLDPQFKKLSREISSVKNKLGMILPNGEMTGMMALVVQTKSQDAEAKQRANALQKKLEKERMEFKNQCELAQKELKQQDGIQKEMEVKSSHLRRQGGSNRAYMVADEEEDFNEISIEKKILKLSFLNAIQRRHIKQHEKNIQVFEQAFATIKSSTGISDIEEIVKIFVKLEERNFSLLTYVNQLNREIESIEMRNCALKKQLTEYNEQEAHALTRKHAALHDLNLQIRKTQVAAGEKDRMVEEAALSLVECRPLIWKIVKSLFEALPALANDGDSDGLGLDLPTPDEYDENLNNYLMYIEEAVMRFRVVIPNRDEIPQTARPPAKGKQDRTLVVKPNDLPSAQLHNDSEDDEDGQDAMGQLPLNRSELKSTVERLLMKRRNRNRGGHGVGQKVEDRRQPEEVSSGQPEKKDDDGTAAPEDHSSDRSKDANFPMMHRIRKEGPVTDSFASSRPVKK